MIDSRAFFALKASSIPYSFRDTLMNCHAEPNDKLKPKTMKILFAPEPEVDKDSQVGGINTVYAIEIRAAA